MGMADELIQQWFGIQTTLPTTKSCIEASGQNTLPTKAAFFELDPRLLETEANGCL
jgi:hypothetical protein